MGFGGKVSGKATTQTASSHALVLKLSHTPQGANQAVQAARLGSEVAMVTTVGDDTFGRDTLQNFKDEGVDSVRFIINNCSDSLPR